MSKRKTVPVRPHVVEVEWEDAASCQGWHDVQEMRTERGTSPCRSVGYLIVANRRVVMIAQTRHDQEACPEDVYQVGDCITIPRSTVKRMRRLR